MKKVLMAFAFLTAMSAFSVSAFADSAIKGAPPTGAGMDMHGPCKTDAAKLCPGMEAGTGLFKCMHEKESQFSTECKAKMAEGHAKMKAAKDACKGDVQKFCKDVKEGGGRIIQCMKAHEAELSAECKAVAKNH